MGFVMIVRYINVHLIIIINGKSGRQSFQRSIISEAIYHLTFFYDRLHPSDGQTDRWTDGRAIAYRALSIMLCCRALKINESDSDT